MIARRKFFVFILIFLVGVVGSFYFLKNKNVGTGSIIIEFDRMNDLSSENPEAGVEPEIDEYPLNSLSGVQCKNYNRRPYAVMLAEDHDARPLSGIGLADLVVEMPVVTGSITRLMAVFVCSDPQEIGSVRSARYDFISLALGYDAIFAHWGGEKLALDKLDNGVIDNLDALPNYFNTFYRKWHISAPHNGFTNMAKMTSAAEKLGYRITSTFEGYTFLECQMPNVKCQNQLAESKTLEIKYKYPYNVRYKYNPEKNSYLRWRAERKEIDKLTGEQVEAKNIVVMRAFSRQISKDYNDVDILGTGKATVYRNGEEVRGTWRKEKEKDVLRFFYELGKEIEFVPGNIWIEVVEPSTIVNYEL